MLFSFKGVTGEDVRKLIQAGHRSGCG
jgi:hypothetical protein